MCILTVSTVLQYQPKKLLRFINAEIPRYYYNIVTKTWEKILTTVCVSSVCVRRVNLGKS